MKNPSFSYSKEIRVIVHRIHEWNTLYISLSNLEKSEMEMNANNVDGYLEQTDPKWKDLMRKMRTFIKNNIPRAFEEKLNHNKIGYVVPLRIYPKGNMGNRAKPLPFLHFEAQQDHLSFYHFGLYGNDELKNWYAIEYERKMGKKANIGKTYIRFEKEEDISFDLMRQLLKKINAEEYILIHEENMMRNMKNI